MNNRELKALADRLLYGFHLSDYLHTIGKVSIVGSYLVDLMVCPDLNIVVENDKMSLEKLYLTSEYIFKTIQPIYYQCKQTLDQESNPQWLIEFKKNMKSEVFFCSISFISKKQIELIQQFYQQLLNCLTDEKRQIIIEIKQELMNQGCYKQQFQSFDVYDAVLNRKITNYQQFMNGYCKNNE